MKIHNHLMLRVPQLPYNANIEDVWNELLESIEYASPEFYEKVANLNPKSLYDQPAKIIQTTLKYFNRAKFRPTPLGTFSAFGIAGIRKEPDTGICIRNKRTVHLYTDWRYINQVDYDFNVVIQKNLKLFCNSTYYQVLDAIRYVRRKEETFELAEIVAGKDIIMILEALKAPLHISELMKQLSDRIEIEQFLELVEAMILSDLILTEYTPNTLGNDYFTRIGQYNYQTPKPYVISQLNILDGHVSNKHFKHIPDLIHLLTRILSPDTNATHMKEFISRYTQLFDRKNIRLMEALDPQLGVGYANFSKGEDTHSIIELLTNTKSDKTKMLFKELKDFFRTGLNFVEGAVIDLGLIPDRLLNRETENKLPNTFSVIGSLIDDHFLLERIGGHSANQIAGRFSFCNDDALNYAKDLSKIEEDANPNIVYFDIAYHAEYAVDNINRRANLYPQELNILSYPGIDQPLTLDDLYISISGDSIILRSERLGKRVVPRMASAYNYRRSQLPVFRFLYDLAFYGVWPELSFDVTQLIPGISYYPKVIYRNIILSLPKLVFHRKDYRSEMEIEMDIKERLKKYRFGNLIKVLKGEEFAVYNLDKADELELFITELKRSEKITIEEMLLPNNPLVEDEDKNQFINQVIVPVVHNNELYPISAAVIHDKTSSERDYLPLQEWLYLDIFVHPLFGDKILLEPITELLNSHKPIIKKWFFIRYNEHGEHLRLRIKAEPESLIEILASFNNLIQHFFNEGIVQDIKICTYRRELERYDFVGMDNVESHFSLGSTLVLSLLNFNITDIEKYQHCLRIMIKVQNSMVIGNKRFVEWTGFIKNSLENEHKMEPATFKALNKFIKDNLTGITEELSEGENEFVTSLIELLQRSNQRRQAPLFTDLMHMHINRLFSEHQRTHELICYNMLHQVIKKNDANKASHVHVLS
ncbi:hypothetical protein D3C87_130060 [compost metagenome]